MYTTRQPIMSGFSTGGQNYNENYFTTRRKLLNDFMKDEETENLKYIEEIESLVSQTKMFLKDLLSGQVDFDILNDQLEDIQTELENDCSIMKGEIATLQTVDANIENQISNLQKEEELATKNYMTKIQNLKNDLESKEFTIQNMERLYIELEDVIKDNIQKGNEQLLTMEQFSDFLGQNNRLKEDIKFLEKEKSRLDGEYNKVLKKNVELRKNNEEFQRKEIQQIINSIKNEEKNKDVKNENLKKIDDLQKKEQKLFLEYENIKNKVEILIRGLRGLDLENQNFNAHLNNIKNELEENENNLMKKRNKSVKNKKIKCKKQGDNLIENQMECFCPKLEEDKKE